MLELRIRSITVIKEPQCVPTTNPNFRTVVIDHPEHIRTVRGSSLAFESANPLAPAKTPPCENPSAMDWASTHFDTIEHHAFALLPTGISTH